MRCRRLGDNVKPRRLAIILALFLLVGTAPVHGAHPLVERFLESRQVVSTVYFDDNSYLLSGEYQHQLELLVSTLKEEISRGRFIRVEGFASDEGRQIYSFKLSLQRAKSVLDFLQNQRGLPEIYLTGYGDLQAEGENPTDEWRVEVVSYANVVDISMQRQPRPTEDYRGPAQPSPISNKSLLDFKQGYMQAISKFDEPLIIDALAIEQVLAEKLDNLTRKPTGTFTQAEWKGQPESQDSYAVQLREEGTIP